LWDLLNRVKGSSPGIKHRIALEFLRAGGLNVPEDIKREARELMVAIHRDPDLPDDVKNEFAQKMSDEDPSGGLDFSDH
jgi:hypothetical protein